VQVYESHAGPKKMLWMLEELKQDKNSTAEDCYSNSETAPADGTAPQGSYQYFVRLYRLIFLSFALFLVFYACL
jgi:hypothetical protein